MKQQPEKWDERTLALVSAYESEGLDTFLSPEDFNRLIDYYEQKEQPGSALAIAQLATDQYRFSPDFYGRQAFLLMQTQQLDEAQAILEEALNIAPGDQELTLLRARLYVYTGALDKGLALLAPYRLQNNQELLSEVLVIESMAYEYQGRYVRMFKTLEKALAADLENEEALARLELAVDYTKNYELAITVFTRFIDEAPYNYRLWYALAQIHDGLGQREEALEAYEYAFITNPDFEPAYLDYAHLAIDLGLYEKALDACQDAAARFHETWHSYHFLLGHCQYELRQYETAKKHLEQAIKDEPFNDEAYYLLGQCLMHLNQHRAAYHYLAKAVRMFPKDARYRSGLAEAAFDLEKYDEAEEHYGEAIKLNHEDLESWLDYGWFLLEMERPTEAEELLHGGLRYLSHSAELNYAHIATLFASGRRQEGLSRLEWAVTNYPGELKQLFEWSPHLETDPIVQALIARYG